MRTLKLLPLLLLFSSLRSQTVYWVGGSGNFNEGQHWSLQSGGSPANIIPNSSSDVVFDDKSGTGNITVNFNGLSNIKSLKAGNLTNTIIFTGPKSAVLDVNGAFNLGTYAIWSMGGTVSFRSGDLNFHKINFGLFPVNSSIVFNEGNFRIHSLTQTAGTRITFRGGKYVFNKSMLSADQLFIEGSNSSFDLDTALFNISGRLNIQNNCNFSSEKAAIYAPFSDKSKVITPAGMNFGNAKLADNLAAVVCSANIVTKPSCSGTCTGVFSVTLDPTCVTPPYNVIVSNTDGSPPCQNTATLLSGNNVPLTYSIGGACYCPGAQYNVFILEGGAVPIPITINGINTSNFNFQPPSFALVTLSQSQPSCFGATNGTMTQAISGGTSPYTVAITNPTLGTSTITAGAGFTLGSMFAGTYSFVLTDANGCVSSVITKTMTQPAAVNPNGVVSNVACANVPCTGSITISPTGGPGGTNYTVSFNPGGNFTVGPGGTASVTGLCAGATVSVLVTSANSCTGVLNPVTITSPPAVTIAPTQTNVTCFGLCNGAASVNVSGGVSPYSFTWSPSGGNAPGATSLCAGQYTVTIRNNGTLCVNTATFNITQPASVALNQTVVNASCFGNCNGSATISPTGGGGPPFSVTWTPAPGGGQGTNTITGLCAGTYSASIIDFAGCTNSAVITITSPPAYTVIVASSSIACFGQCTGSASLSISGSVPPYTIVWTPTVGGGQGTGTVTGLCANSYTANITSAAPNNCTTTATVSIAQPPPMVANVTSASITCNAACNGSIGANPTGGNGAPYTFSLVTPLGATITAAPPYTNLCAGVYTLVIADNGACPQTFTINLQQPNPLVPSISMSSVTCFNACNGSLAGNVIGGTPGYTLSWTNGTVVLTGPVITNQCAGNYTLNVLDANGCTASATAALLQPTQIQATLNVTNPSCNGLCNGNISAVLSGGTPGYSLTWLPTNQTGNPAINLCAGTHTLNVTDANGCTRSFTANVVAPPAIAVSQTITSPVCAGQCNGSATFSASGGASPYNYQLNIFPPVTNTTGIFTGLCPGNYNVTITDANGCNTSVSFSIANPPVLSVSVNSILTSCNACTGGGTVTASGGTPTYNIVWTNSLAVTVGTGTSVAGLCPGPFTVTVTDAAGCVTTTTLNVAQTVSVSVSIAGSGINCFNACTGSAVATPTGGVGPYTFTWLPSGQNTGTATGLCPGIHTVTAADANGCSNTGTINLANPPDITVTVTQTNVACNGSCTGVLSATATGGTGPKTFTWMPGNLNSATINSLCAGGYTLTVADANGCTKTFTYSITTNPAITTTVNASNPTSCANNNGSICVTVSGGSGGPYTYSWMPGGQTTSCITNLAGGVYTLMVFDGPCTSSLVVSLTNPSGPTVAINTSSVNCFGGNTGGATVTAAGTPNFTFTWGGGVPSFTNGATSATASGIPTGTYNITVTDGNGCPTSMTFAIGQSSSITVNSNAVNQKCNPPSPCNGSITIAPSGGAPNYTITFLPGPITATAATGATVSNTGLCNGNYTVNISDANSCTRTLTFALVAPPAITLATSVSNIPCFNQCNGSLGSNATGGTGAFSYSWQPGGQITASIVNQCAGVYTVMATDQNLCVLTRTLAITQPSSAITSTLSFLNPSCSNSCNATATILAAGGTPSYSFNWTGGPTTSTVGGLCGGNYSVTVTDANGCATVTPFTITAPAPFNATLVPSSPLCNNSCNGSISTTLAGNQGAVSFTWSPAGTGQNPTALCAGTYTMLARDANSCQVTAITTLTNPPAILPNVSFTNPACSGTCNGVMVSNPVNANNPVSFTWSPGGQNTSSVTGRCAGTHTLIIVDNNSCTATQTITLVNPAPLNVNPAITPATCSQSNGAINVGVTGGTPTYSFTWAPPVGTGSVATGLGAGIYTVNVTDANNCANSVAIALSNANGPSVTPVSTTSLACFGQNTGGATVNVGGIQGGTPGYTVSWVVPPAPSSVNPLSGLTAGSYTAQTTDANGCILFTVATVAQPSSISINPNFTLATCNGNCNGVIVLGTSGGSPGYTYAWNPLGPNNSATLTNACAGTYTINITDAQSCPRTVTVNLPATINMLAGISPTNNVCSNSCIAVASVTNVSGGLSPYAYSWSNGQVGPTAFNLCNGVYTVIVTDANNCFNSFTTSITSPPAITATPAVAAPGCSLCNGSSTVTASGGTAPYTFSWTSGSSTNVANNLCAGLYQVLITDNFGCNITQNVVISSSTGITGQNFTVQSAACGGTCNGAASVTPIGGTAPITYSWMSPPSNNSFVTNLCPGNYFVQMTDANGCVRTASTNVGAVSAITISPFVMQPSCGSNNGSISIAIAGGSPGYTINWAPPAAPPNGTIVTGLAAGIYSVTVTDQGGCTQSQAFTLSNSNAPVITFTQSNVTCFGASTGSITVVGNTTSTPVTYSWSNGSSAPTATGLPAGVHVVTVTAANGCRAIQAFTVTQNSPMMLSLSNIVQPRCFNDCNGAITLVPNGGTLPYTFTWSPGALSGNPQFSLCSGTYTATVIDGRGCFTTAVSTLTNPAQYSVSTTFTNSSCSTTPDGAAVITATGGTGPLTYSWTGPNSFSATTTTVTGIVAGTYTVIVTDTRSCTANATVQIVPTITIDAVAGPNDSLCTNLSIILNGSNSIGANSYLWIKLGPPNTTLATTSSVNVTPTTGSNTFVLQAISSVSSCVDADTVIVKAFPLPLVDAGANTIIPVYSSVQIGGNPTSPSAVTLTWTPGFTLDNPSIQNPVASNTLPTIYTVMVTDANGCVASDTVRVDLYPAVIIPNGFSPNGDTKNEKWVIDNLDQFPDNEVSVYNRWGELLFFRKGYNNDFDGRYNGKDLPVGTYYYVVILNHQAYPNPYTGPLTIFR